MDSFKKTESERISWPMLRLVDLLQMVLFYCVTKFSEADVRECFCWAAIKLEFSITWFATTLLEFPQPTHSFLFKTMRFLKTENMECCFAKNQSQPWSTINFEITKQLVFTLETNSKLFYKKTLFQKMKSSFLLRKKTMNFKKT